MPFTRTILPVWLTSTVNLKVVPGGPAAAGFVVNSSAITSNTAAKGIYHSRVVLLISLICELNVRIIFTMNNIIRVFTCQFLSGLCNDAGLGNVRGPYMMLSGYACIIPAKYDLQKIPVSGI